MSWPLILVVLSVIALVWLGLKFATPQAGAISPDDPVWTAAIARARATIPDMLELHHGGHDVWVKFPLRTSADTTEHVWGRVTEATNGSVECTLETAPIGGSELEQGAETTVSIEEVEDWQVELADGTIRGGFTTRAQAEIARRQGERVPRHIEEMIRRMTDGEPR